MEAAKATGTKSTPYDFGNVGTYSAPKNKKHQEVSTKASNKPAKSFKAGTPQGDPSKLEKKASKDPAKPIEGKANDKANSKLGAPAKKGEINPKNQMKEMGKQIGKSGSDFAFKEIHKLLNQAIQNKTHPDMLIKQVKDGMMQRLGQGKLF